MSLGPGTSALTPTLLDPPRIPARVQTVQRQFDRRAPRFAQHDAVVREVERRLIDRLDLIRVSPATMLDVGCGAGHSQAALARRYPKAQWIGADLSHPMLRAGAPKHVWGALRRRLTRGGSSKLQAAADALPLPEGSVQLLLSNLMLHWHPAPHTVFPEWHRVLAVGGLLLFSCFGPDTLKELRQATAASLPHARPMPFIDMHDFGDMMVAAGFATPVMDVEVLRLTFESPAALLREVRSLGGNPRDDRFAGLTGADAGRALRAALEAQRDRDGRISLTFEVAYGHAWKASPSTPPAVTLDALRSTLPSQRPGR